MTFCPQPLHFGDEPCTIFTLQGLDFITSGSWDTPYGVEAVTGWGDGSAATGGPVAWDTADGGVESDVHYGPMTITIEGDIDARTHQEYADAVQALKTVLKRPRWDWLVGDESVHLGVVRQVRVTRTRPVQVTQLGATYGIFTLQLESASAVLLGSDPQSVTISTAGTPMKNIGDADADLSLTLVGPLTDPGISWPGGAWSYGGSVAAGQTLSVDLTRRTVRDPATTGHSRNDVLGLGAGSWPRLAPGTTVFTRTGTGSGTISMGWRSAWS